MHNHITRKERQIIGSKKFEVLNRHPENNASKPMKDAITAEAIYKMDWMSNSQHMQNVRKDVATEPKQHKHAVFTHSGNLSQKKQEHRWSKQKRDAKLKLSWFRVIQDADLSMVQS